MIIKLYHDAFLQFGGAERIPIVWASDFRRTITCFGSQPKLFAENLEIIDSISKRLRNPGTLMILFPFVNLSNSKEKARLVFRSRPSEFFRISPFFSDRSQPKDSLLEYTHSLDLEKERL